MIEPNTLSASNLTMRFCSHREEPPKASAHLLPILINSCPDNFSTVDYFEVRIFASFKDRRRAFVLFLSYKFAESKIGEDWSTCHLRSDNDKHNARYGEFGIRSWIGRYCKTSNCWNWAQQESGKFIYNLLNKF